MDTHSAGTTDSKQTNIDGVKANKLSYRNIERLQERVQIYGKTAVVSGQARIDVLIASVPRIADRFRHAVAACSDCWYWLRISSPPALRQSLTSAS